MLKKCLILLIVNCLLVTAALAQYEAPDPSRNIPNARVLGMGRAYIGLSDDSGAIFCNPAGLAKISDWQVTSMSGKFLDEFSYLSFSGLYPTQIGSFGLGFMGAGISGAFSTMKDPNSSDDDPIYIIDTSQPPINYSNNVYIVSYGTELSRFLNRFGWEKYITLGANLKLFATSLTGDAITQGSASGSEVDLGVIYSTRWPWWTVGVALKNALTGAMGGRLVYETGHEETYPMSLEFGNVFKLVGPNNSPFKYNQQEVMLLVDYYLKPTMGLPATTHLGVEYKPNPLLAVRLGIDQDIMGDGTGTSVGTVNNLTGGVGLYVGGFRFDYAYHQFAGISEVTNNYFSLSYGLPVKQEVGPLIVVTEPKDQALVFEDEVIVQGKAIDKSIDKVKVNSQFAKIDLKGGFETELTLNPGKNKVIAAGYDGDRLVAEEPVRVLKLQVFPDVARDFWVAKPISLLAMQKIVSGYPDGSFKPQGNITRAEMCAMLMKAWSGSREAEARNIFRDISANHWAAKYIAQAAKLGVVKGYEDSTFRPGKNISRAEGLIMIARFAGILEKDYTNEFVDVKLSHWAAKTIAGAQAAGLL
ncbi:MAG: S-layer homology domain-containing protein, partial [bacterium]